MADTLRALDELYARIPDVDCKGRCQNACGPIDCSDAERQRVADAGVQLPSFTEARVLAWAANRHQLPDGSTLDCPALGALGQCAVYPVRPMICRLWGAVESMPCEHGCRPRRYLTDTEGLTLLMESLRVGGSKFAGSEDEIIDLLSDPEITPHVGAYVRNEPGARQRLLDVLDTRTARR